MTTPPARPATKARRTPLCVPLVRFLPTLIMLGFGLLLPVLYRLWSWAAGVCR